MCRPIDSGIDLVRIGGENDGGYLIPADLTGVDCCFSPGVSNSARFEEELEAKFGIKSHLADFSVPGPPHGFVPKSFDRKFISSYTKDNRLSFDDWIENCVPQQESRDLIMQVNMKRYLVSAREILIVFELLRLKFIILNSGLTRHSSRLLRA